MESSRFRSRIDEIRWRIGEWEAFFSFHVLLGKGLLLLFLSLCLLICWQIGLRHEYVLNLVPGIPETAEEWEEDFSFLAVTPLDTVTDMAGARTIDLTACTDEVLITEGGDYLLSGTLEGTVIVTASEQDVRLILDGAEIVSPEGPAIVVAEAAKAVLTLASGSRNTISDSGHYPVDGEYEACISSNCDLTINGSGSLDVYGLYKDAVRSKDILKILDGAIQVHCKRTAFRGNDGIYVTGGELRIFSEKDGLKTTKSGLNGRGNLMIAGGDHTIIAGRYAFVAVKARLYLYDCTVHERSVVGTYNVGGKKFIQKGCLQ